jgi:hypothetical protein
MSTKELVLKYFYSWQKKDWEEMRSCLSDSLEFAPGTPFKSPDDFVNFCKTQGSPWRNVTLIGGVFTEEQASLFYEGIITATEKKIQVGELITVSDGKIVKLYGVCQGGSF